MKKTLFVLALLAAVVTNAASDSEVFKAKTFEIDLGGNYTTSQRDYRLANLSGLTTEGKYAAQVGLTYFATKHFGVGVNTSMSDFDGLFIDNVNVKYVARYPYKFAAPYFFATTGAALQQQRAFTHGYGIGFEVRPHKNFGLYTELEYRFNNSVQGDKGLVSFGTRINF